MKKVLEKKNKTKHCIFRIFPFWKEKQEKKLYGVKIICSAYANKAFFPVFPGGLTPEPSFHLKQSLKNF